MSIEKYILQKLDKTLSWIPKNILMLLYIENIQAKKVMQKIKLLKTMYISKYKRLEGEK